MLADPDEFLRRFARCLSVSERWRLLQILRVLDAQERDDEQTRRVRVYVEGLQLRAAHNALDTVEHVA